MQVPLHPRDRRSGTLDSVPRALLFAAAMMIGCGLTTAPPAADDKAKASAETPPRANAPAPAKAIAPAPSKATVEAPSKAAADTPATTPVPAPEAAADVSAKTDS